MSIYVHDYTDLDGDYEVVRFDGETTIQELNEFLDDRYSPVMRLVEFEAELDNGWLTGIKVSPSDMFEDA